MVGPLGPRPSGLCDMLSSRLMGSMLASELTMGPASHAGHSEAPAAWQMAGPTREKGRG